MMLTAAVRAVYLAEEQMRGESWKVPDKDEADEPCACWICDTPLVPFAVHTRYGKVTLRRPTKGSRLCPTCISAGWRNADCVVCGGPTRTWNWTSKRRGNKHRGYCPQCRVESHRNMEGA